MIIFTGQKDQWELDDLIEEEIKNQDSIKVNREKYKSELQHFKTPLENWWRSKKRENITPEMLTDWLQRAKTKAWASDISGSFESCTKKFVSIPLKFSDSDISRLQAELSNKRAVHLRSDALTLCSMLLLDCVPQPKCIFVTYESLQSNKNTLLHAWLGGHWEWLIVLCDTNVQNSDISDTCPDVSDIIKYDHLNKRVIILTASSAEQITGVFLVEHEFNFEHLSNN